MALPNIFTRDISGKIIERINELTWGSKANWGRMDVAQMLAHCNVTYEMVYENKHPKPNLFMRFILKVFIKKTVVSETIYKQNSQTAPMFIIIDEKNFIEEKSRLINYINKTQHLGESEFDNKLSRSFGKLNKEEWNNMFYKHLDHHLKQFSV